MWTVRASLVNVVSLVGMVLMVLCPGAPAAAAAPPQDALHQVMPGDDLRLIAGYYYGDTRQWERIWEANREQISNPNRIERGALLRIPDAVVPAEPYADFVARAHGLAPPPTAPAAAETREAPAAGAPPSEAAPTIAAPTTGLPAGEPLPPPSGPVTLRFKPAKGFVQTASISSTGKNLMERGGRSMPMDLHGGARLRMAVEDVGSDGMVRLALSLSDKWGNIPSFAGVGLPEPGETLRLTVSPLNGVVRVEGKERGSNYYYYSPAVLFNLYPEAPLAIGGSWQYETTIEEAIKDTRGLRMSATAAHRCTLVRRERFQNEDAYRIQCQGTASIPPNAKADWSSSYEATAVVRARDGTPMATELAGRTSMEFREVKTRLLNEGRTVYQQEAPRTPAQAAAPGGPTTPSVPSKEPAKQP